MKNTRTPHRKPSVTARRDCREMPPHDVELEQEVLSALCFGYKEACEHGFNVLEPEDFHVPQHQIMFRGLKEAHKQGIVYQSPALFVAWLRDSGTMQKLSQESGEDLIVMSDWAYTLRDNALPTAVLNYAAALKTLRARRDIRAMLRDSMDDFERGDVPSLWLKRAGARLQAVKRSVEKIPTPGVNGQQKQQRAG